MDPEPSQIDALWRAARTLGRRAGRGKLPPLFFFTDPARVRDPTAVAETLPRGAGVVYRAFGAQGATTTGRRLAEVCRRRSLLLLAGADPRLAEAIDADGVHLPERLWREAEMLRRRRPDWTLTAAAHSRRALRRLNRAPLDAVFISPVFASDSPSAGRPIGARRLERWARMARAPVYALGGVDSGSIARLARSGVAGIAAVSALGG